jgi:hypothetical protein
MKVKISRRTTSYAVYIYDYDSDEFVERAINVISRYNYAWLQEVYDGRYKKIVVLRHVA